LSDQAVEIMEIAPRGPAEAAGLKRGDFIVAVGGRIVTGMDDLHQILAGAPAARQLLITVLRAGQILDVPIEPRLGE
jgi:S1-C subfamily serine protease